MFERLENELAITERHLTVLEGVAEYEPVGLITLTNRLSYPKHKVRYSLRILETHDLVDSTDTGIVTTDQVADFQSTANRRLTRIAHTLDRLRITQPSAPTAASSPVSSD